MAVQLTYVYNQILSVLTLRQLDSIMTRRGNYDLRRLLGGKDWIANFRNRKKRLLRTAISSDFVDCNSHIIIYLHICLFRY